jgi:hypothetical protein
VAVVGEHRDQVLDRERKAAARLDDRRRGVGRKVRMREQAFDELGGGRVGQRLRRRIARPAGHEDDEQRSGDGGEHAVERIARGRRRAVGVVDDDHQRAARDRGREHVRDRRGELVGRSGSGVADEVGGDRIGSLAPILGDEVAHAIGERGRVGRGVDAEHRADERRERPRRPAGVGTAAREHDGPGSVRGLTREPPRDRGPPASGLAAQRDDDGPPAVDRGVERVVQSCERRLAFEQGSGRGRLGVERGSAVGGHVRGWLVDRHGLGPPLLERVRVGRRRRRVGIERRGLVQMTVRRGQVFDVALVARPVVEGRRGRRGGSARLLGAPLGRKVRLVRRGPPAQRLGCGGSLRAGRRLGNDGGLGPCL